MAGNHDARAEASETWSSLGAAVSGAWDDARLLIAQHATLASREATARTSGLGVDVALLVMAALLLQGALLALLVALGFAVRSAGAPPWLAALTVAVLAMILAAALGLAGRTRLRQRARAPSPTVMALRDTGAWLSDTVGSLRS